MKHQRPLNVTLSLEDVDDNDTYATLLQYIQKLEKEVDLMEDELARRGWHIDDEPLDCW